ncbi:hypothetical protein BJ322DRAFT_1106618 [Thelephora terrestris]|uniref:Uncharacterized protein n=1 Tax=Thelephora terrestris TaxID=56493 RepID=A0A9P6L9M5_9AGAM|nr:hypothetical protein BJ322DRAFT_1106618 [Thelephora terrestris]
MPSPSSSRFHRRLPSAPHVSVQPTQTPGLLSIIPKQQRSSQQHKSQQRMTPLKENQRQNRLPKTSSAKSAVVLPEVIKLSVVESDKPKSLKAQSKNTSTPDKSSSGRTHQKRGPKDKATADRSAPPTPAKQTRRPARQPSPPALCAQAEASLHIVSEPKNPSSNFFDPFLSNSSDSDLTDTKSKSTFKSLPPPKLGRPSGKLANRRQQSIDATQTPTKAIPVPRSNKGRSANVANVSRSAPVSNVKSTVLQTHLEDPFPICDDMTDIDGEGSRPSTPVPKVPTRQQRSIFFDNGPRTAPLSSMTTSFPFSLSTPSPTVRKHHRAPSDGVFNMSLDEDSSSDNSEGLRNLFNDLLSHKRRSDGQKAGYFASSQFQNSPSPEDLPAPDFIH